MTMEDIKNKLNELIELANKHTVGMNQMELYVYRAECERMFSISNITEAKQ